MTAPNFTWISLDLFGEAGRVVLLKSRPASRGRTRQVRLIVAVQKDTPHSSTLALVIEP
jgi:hypothetical protein